MVALSAAAIIGVTVWVLARTPGLWGWPAWWGFGGLGIVVAWIILYGVLASRRIRRVVGEALRDRPPLTDEAFGVRFFEPAIAPIAARLRRRLAENLACDLAGLMPADDFECWLGLSSGPDSAADMFFEELAIEYRLARDLPWPARFGSFDALVQFVARYGQLPGICPRDRSDSGMARSWVKPRNPDPPGNESGTGPPSGEPGPRSHTPNTFRPVSE